MIRLISVIRGWFKHEDKIKALEVRAKYGFNAPRATRDSKTDYDLLAKTINANVAIAITAISDAMSMVRWDIVSLTSKGGVEREEEDIDHEANEIIRNPNPLMTLREIMEHIVKSLFGDGNAILTIERKTTGGQTTVELWPRDPRRQFVDIEIKNGQIASYSFTDGQRKLFYKPQDVIHLRELTPEQPFWGVSRIDPVRLEIEMDYQVNAFNKDFFKNGAVLNLMFTPKENLSETQHQMLVAAFNASQTGEGNWFSVFINQFAGAFTTPDQKHKDIAFLDLLKHNREKIFGVFHLPPFRGGVMEYANYANALAQDTDFWNNTVRPLTCKIEDAINKQLLWPLYGEDIRLRANYDDVPALKGSPKEQAEIDAIYVREGIMTANEIRERLGMSPIEEAPEPEENPGEETPTPEEEEDVEDALLGLFSKQRKQVREGLQSYTAKGRLMSLLVVNDGAAGQVFALSTNYEQLNDAVLPVVSSIIRKRLPHISQEELAGALQQVHLYLENIGDETHALLGGNIRDCATYGWTLSRLVRHCNSMFAQDRAKSRAKEVLKLTFRRIDALILDRRISESLNSREVR